MFDYKRTLYDYDLAMSLTSTLSKFYVGLKSLLHQVYLEPEFYGDLHVVYELKNIVCSNYFSAHFIKIIIHFKKIGYNMNILQLCGQPNYSWQLCFPI